MQTPVFTIASNAGVEGAVVVGKLLEQDNPDLGYDAAKGLLLHILIVLSFYMPFVSFTKWMVLILISLLS